MTLVSSAQLVPGQGYQADDVLQSEEDDQMHWDFRGWSQGSRGGGDVDGQNAGQPPRVCKKV